MLRTDNFERSNLLRLGRPMVITGYSTVLMLVTDAVMVGRLGPEELAAVASSGLILFQFLQGHNNECSVAAFIIQLVLYLDREVP